MEVNFSKIEEQNGFTTDQWLKWCKYDTDSGHCGKYRKSIDNWIKAGEPTWQEEMMETGCLLTSDLAEKWQEFMKMQIENPDSDAKFECNIQKGIKF